jgi:hypothetical protein
MTLQPPARSASAPQGLATEVIVGPTAGYAQWQLGAWAVLAAGAFHLAYARSATGYLVILYAFALVQWDRYLAPCSAAVAGLICFALMIEAFIGLRSGATSKPGASTV